MKYSELTDLLNELNDNDRFKDYSDYVNLFDLADDLQDKYNALQEKIEDGALVELPKPFIDETHFIDIFNGELHIRYDIYQNIIRTIHFVEDTFYDKEAAEQRLKELRDEK